MSTHRDVHQPHDHLPAVDAGSPASDYDVIVVGGGPAGLAGALSLSRAGRSVLVVDAGEPRNAPASAVHNLLGNEGAAPADLRVRGMQEVEAYGARVVDGRVAAARRVSDEAADPRFVATVDSARGGHEITARRILLASGVTDVLPEVEGIRDHWGGAVVHCPFCHGHEVRDQRIVILGATPMAGHSGLLWRQWTPHLTLLLDPAVSLERGEVERLHARGVRIVAGTAAALEERDGQLTGVRTSAGDVLPCDHVVAPVVSMPAPATIALLADLDLAPTPWEMNGATIAHRLEAAGTGQTAAPGVYAAGNLVEPHLQVVASRAAGAQAAAMLLMDLISADADAAVAAARAEFFERPAWEERFGGDEQAFSGRVNETLAAYASDLPPGRALDAGAGEGGDVLWLAERGWDVTALEFSEAGRRRIGERASAAGLADRVSLRGDDVRELDTAGETWDLVTAFFVHLPEGGMVDATRRLAAAVAPGGTLLVVGHHPGDMPPGSPMAMHCHTAAELAAALDDDAWIVTAEDRPRVAGSEHGAGHHLRDTVLRAVRRRDRAATGSRPTG